MHLIVIPKCIAWLYQGGVAGMRSEVEVVVVVCVCGGGGQLQACDQSSQGATGIDSKCDSIDPKKKTP